MRPLDTKYLLLEPKLCGEIFENDGSVMGGMLITTEGWATIYDGAILGHNYNLNSDPVYVGDDRLSLIRAYGGNDFFYHYYQSLQNKHENDRHSK